MKTERFDIHQHITDQIVSAIERGAGVFRLPWAPFHRQYHAARQYCLEKSLSRRQRHGDVGSYAEDFGYSPGVWGSYRQWAEAGAQVRKGEKAAFVVFYKELETAADPETDDAERATRIFASATPVFAAEQVDGYQAPASDASPVMFITPFEQAEAFVAAAKVSLRAIARRSAAS